MSRLFRQFNWRAPTIARDLIVGLTLTITVVFALAVIINYTYSIKRDTVALYEKAQEITANLASVLASPLWNLNVEELSKIIDVYRQSGIVLDIQLRDDGGRDIVARQHDMQAFLELVRPVYHEGRTIGELTVHVSDADIITKQREIIAYSAAVFTIATLALAIATALLLRRFLTEPFRKILSGLDLISSGDYSHRFEPARQADIAIFAEKITGMAGEIARRESAIEENRAKLETLNQAILDIFSCSEANQLVSTILRLAYQVCGVRQSWFAPGPFRGAVQPPPNEEELKTAPIPKRCFDGQIATGTDFEIRPFVEQPTSERIFRFTISSRHRTVGEITLAFAEAPDASTTSLLNSLMSLATLAMTRQSFIRETAFIAAELQVAEAVQRSMLPDDNKLPSNALVSYHYEPVLRVGGDWFSVIESRDGENLYVILGDVTGHGLAQGLVTTAVAGAMQVVQSMIHDFDGVGVAHPSQILTQLDNVIGRIAGKSHLRMTCVCARLDFAAMQLYVCNAGHTFPFVLHRYEDHSTKLETLARNQQPMLGEDSALSPDKGYSDTSYPLHHDDLLFFYTDGLTEALNSDGKAFGRKFHRHLAHLHQPSQPQTVKDELIRQFRAHTSGMPVKDDICLLVVGKRRDDDPQRVA